MLRTSPPTGLLISAIRSGAGKTTVTLGLLAALARRGIRLRAAKAGPDYIDPAFHAAATGVACINLDSWTMSPPLLQALMARATAGADLVAVEGVMGLFDGVPAANGRNGSSASIAAQFGLPVILVLDVTAQSQSAAAVVRGFATHHPDVRIAGVVLNRVGSARHRKLITDAIAALDIPVVGAVPRDAAFALPERHLGLVQAGEHGDLARRITALADMAEAHLDLDAILALAAPIDTSLARSSTPALPPPGQRIALASDAAFSFIYPHLIDGWRDAGAEIVRFSPLADEAPPEDCDSCWLPGGYPELHAGALAAATTFRDGLARFAQTRPVHGECGGYMVLGEGLEDADGHRHAMTGLLGHTTSFQKRKLHLGYREAKLVADSAIGSAGAIIRGHEFHYASLTDIGRDEPLVDLVNADGQPLPERGGRRGHVTGTFFHAIATA
ncbi:cobyrinate a,c-diamide synthase [Tardiphaga alba]|uniref:Hydrogenobyrinate a,c-diamide synthase n=1 Tax=Tardiphaga alba TaxID=340268 RepID=A0ABX8ACQ1_9BRAD|nr:cobyrinate a,c-diamide synthase [Tardiphaga alba]QUS41528.1 cobyrinate a,c-diamide synthase [Tardiphaga alba]